MTKCNIFQRFLTFKKVLTSDDQIVSDNLMTNRLSFLQCQISWKICHKCWQLVMALVTEQKLLTIFDYFCLSKIVTKCNIFQRFLTFKKVLTSDDQIVSDNLMTNRLSFLQCQISWKICHKCWQLVMALVTEQKLLTIFDYFCLSKIVTKCNIIQRFLTIKKVLTSDD